MLNKILNPLDHCNLKFQDDGEVKNGVFEGYASTFGNVDEMGDTILPGAFSDTLANRKTAVKMFYQHNRTLPIGKWLEMREDDTGLFVRGELTPGHSVAADVYASLRHGALDGLSIGFRVPANGKTEKESGKGRLLSKINLVEISPVSLPADESATVLNIKATAEEIGAIESIRDCELFLREAGFSRSTAKAFISQVRPVFQREVDAALQQKEAMASDIEWVHNLINQVNKGV